MKSAASLFSFFKFQILSVLIIGTLLLVLSQPLAAQVAAKEHPSPVFVVIKDNKCGLINATGEQLLPCEYDAISEFAEGLAVLWQNDKAGVTDQNGRIIVPFEYDSIKPYSDGLAVVIKDGKYGLIDKTGNRLDMDYVDEMSSRAYDGLFLVKLNQKYGYMDRSGKIVIPCIYEQASTFSEGLAAVSNNPSDGRDEWGFIDKSGKLVIPYNRFCFVGWFDFRYGKGPGFVEGYYPVQYFDFGKRESVHGFIDKEQRVVIPFAFQSVQNFSEGLAAVEVGRKWGYIDTQGNIVIPCEYDMVGDFSEGRAIVYLSWSNQGLIDRTGKLLAQVNDCSLSFFDEEYTMVTTKGDKSGLIDKTGKVVIPIIYDLIGNFSEGLAPVSLNGLYGYINESGETVIPYRFNDAWSFEDGVAVVVQNGEYGLIDRTGRVSLLGRYDYIGKSADTTDYSDMAAPNDEIDI